MSWVATAVIGGSAVTAAVGAYSANKAANAQKQAADNSAALQLQMFNQTNANLQPFRDIGKNAGDQLNARLPELTSPINMTEDQLQQTPGYQFTLTQGLKAAQNSAAARGLGVSGAALKGASTFATGLADSTYKTQFDIANTNQTNAYNRLKGLVDTGAAAAGATGTLGEKAAYNAGQAEIQGGNAQAAGTNAIGGALINAANNIAGYGVYKGLYGNNNDIGASSVRTG